MSNNESNQSDFTLKESFSMADAAVMKSVSHYAAEHNCNSADQQVSESLGQEFLELLFSQNLRTKWYLSGEFARESSSPTSFNTSSLGIQSPP